MINETNTEKNITNDELTFSSGARSWQTWRGGRLLRISSIGFVVMAALLLAHDLRHLLLG